MLADIHEWVALIMPSDDYGAMADAVVAFRHEHQLPELHGNEIVTPGSGSPWKPVPVELRLAAFKFACDLAAGNAAELRYVHISKRQFQEMVAENPCAPFKTTKHKPAVMDVFKHCLVERRAETGPSLAVCDKDKNNPGATLEKIHGAADLLGGGLIRATSHEVPGLQIVDVVAYAIGRYLKKREAIIAETGSDFEDVAVAFVGQLQSRFKTLL